MAESNNYKWKILTIDQGRGCSTSEILQTERTSSHNDDVRWSLICTADGSFREKLRSVSTSQTIEMAKGGRLGYSPHISGNQHPDRMDTLNNYENQDISGDLRLMVRFELLADSQNSVWRNRLRNSGILTPWLQVPSVNGISTLGAKVVLVRSRPIENTIHTKFHWPQVFPIKHLQWCRSPSWRLPSKLKAKPKPHQSTHDNVISLVMNIVSLSS